MVALPQGLGENIVVVGVCGGASHFNGRQKGEKERDQE
jgi:hypothetical protein